MAINSVVSVIRGLVFKPLKTKFFFKALLTKRSYDVKQMITICAQLLGDHSNFNADYIIIQ